MATAAAPMTFTLESVLGATSGAPTPHDALGRLIKAARVHLGMDVAFISEFVDGARVFRHVDAAGPTPVVVGGSDSLEDSYCQRVVDGRLPQLIHDPTEHPAALELAVTTALPVGSHVSVPIAVGDGRVYGTFCCFRTDVDRSLTERDLSIVRLLAELAAGYVEADIGATHERRLATERINGVLSGTDSLTSVFQPVVRLTDGRVVGVEALARFPKPHVRPPNVWFTEAAELGLGVDLEIRALQTALLALDDLPQDVWLSVNLSPAVLLERTKLDAALAGVDLRRVVIEMTEHAPVADYYDLNNALRPFRERGARVAVDDAGAGYASLRHILWLMPDVIKIDISITRDIDTDPARTALASALIAFAKDMGSSVVAEGIETERERATLHNLGAGAGQGYHLGRPADLVTAINPVRT